MLSIQICQVYWPTNKQASLRTTKHVDKCLRKLRKDSKLDSVSLQVFKLT